MPKDYSDWGREELLAMLHRRDVTIKELWYTIRDYERIICDRNTDLENERYL